ncbi:ABC transporter ATP-binding protein [Dyadobacter sediminis]|uniref:ABC transporter ATP-binding protein n=1 Tax=Dyadobacter sediminis TaxID=1493691 RepID=A0A5R9KJ07_9BACT|nr:ABC transporter ATP-binding protein [Dyadobacter sediminis]TLU96164.1 ABC transporter ATP-binding protein [Dyadobacter sediminis]GGB79816.1 ABC transporter ATP-binding protein [Dyadobacter sediminis]
MIIAENISKKFRAVHAVNNVSFEVKEGNTLVLLGTSGCGKTTTLKMLNRLIEATSGTIYINEKNIFDQKPEFLRRTIGYVSQNNGLFPHYTVAENVAIVPKLLKWSKTEIIEKTVELLDQLKLPFAHFANKYPNELSGGQQQRVALARALISDPPVMLMDEPFGALDPVTRAQVRAEFTAMPLLKRKTIVLVTHDIQEAFELGDAVCLMDKGKIVQSGTAKELMFKPENEFVKSFFDQQRLFLELKSLTFDDVWNEFETADETTQTPLFLSSKSLWEGMEKLSNLNKNRLIVYQSATKSLKYFTLTAIQNAAASYKQGK